MPSGVNQHTISPHQTPFSQANNVGAEVDVLQFPLENLQSDSTSQRSDLEEQERKVKKLEVKMVKWELKRKETSDERLLLGSMVGKVALACKSLKILMPATDGTGFMTPASGISIPNCADLSLEG